MASERSAGGVGESRRRRASYAERRARRAQVDDETEVLDAAARYLEARPRSIAEVRRRLTDGGYRSELVETVVARLIELGYLDDDAFARAWIESRDRAHPRGERALRAELRRKGVAAELADHVLAERREATDPEAPDVDAVAAERLLDRHARSLAREPDPRRRRQRAYALLARNGFDPSIAADAARRFIEEPG